MPWMVTVGFDSAVQFSKRVRYFRYGSERFKLILNDPRKYSNVILAVVESGDEATFQRVYATAAEFVSALCFERDMPMAVRPLGSRTVSEAFTLRNSRCSVFVPPRLHFRGEILGSTLSRVARITNESQRRALAMYREAIGSNKLYLEFLFYWQILGLRGRKEKDEAQRILQVSIDRITKDPHLYEIPKLANRLGKPRTKLAAELEENGRHAIAHITRDPGRQELRFDDRAEEERLQHSTRIARALARHFIATELEVTDHLWLVRPRKGGFPAYRGDEETSTGLYVHLQDPNRPLGKGLRYRR